MSEHLELGQIGFGNPVGEYEADDLGLAVLDAVLRKIDLVFWNREQREWDRYEDPRIPGLTFNRYYWGEDPAEAVKPNLAFGDIEFRWYKHPGRGTTLQRAVTPDAWAVWLTAALDAVRAEEERRARADGERVDDRPEEDVP